MNLNILRQWVSSPRVGWLVLLLLSLGLRFPAAINLPAAVIYNVDEIDFLRSALGMFVGLTPTNLQWPAGVPMLISVPLIIVHFVLTSSIAQSAIISADLGGLIRSLTLYSGENLYDLRSLLVIGRVTIALVASTIPLVTLMALGRYLSNTIKLIIAVILATSPALIAETSILKGDAIGLVFWSISAYCILRFWADKLVLAQRTNIIVTAFVFLGLATASRFTYAIVFPILTMAVFIGLGRRGLDNSGFIKGNLRIVLVCLAAFVVPLIVFVPYVVTHSITTVKQLVGNLWFLTTVSQVSSDRMVLLTSATNQVGWLALGFAVIGSVIIWRKKRRMAGWVSWLVFLVFFLPLFRSRYVELRYTLPLLPILALWSAIGISSVAQWLNSRWGWRPAWVNGVIVFFILAINMFSIGQWWIRIQQPTPVTQLFDWVAANTTPSQRIAVPYTLAFYIPPDITALERLLNAYANSPDSARQRLSSLLGKVGRQSETGADVPLYVVNVLFGNQEAMDVFQYTTMQYTARAGKIPGSARNVWYYAIGEVEKPDQIAYVQAIQLFQMGQIDVLITNGKEARLGDISPDACPSSWCVYLFKSQK